MGKETGCFGVVTASKIKKVAGPKLGPRQCCCLRVLLYNRTRASTDIS